jgi:hypothetical protein
MTTETNYSTLTHTGSWDSKRRLNTQPVGSGSSLGSGAYSKSETVGYSREPSPNANFLSRMRDGEVVIGPYSTTGSRNIHYKGVTGRCSYYAGASYTDDVTYVDAPFLTRAAAISALGTYSINLNSHKVLASTSAQARMLSGAAETAVAWVERYKTLSLMATSASRLIRILRSARQSIRRGSAIKDLREFSREMSFDDALNAWMEYRYGWRPLLYDVANHQTAIANILNDTGQYWKARARSDHSGAVSLSNVDLGDSLYTNPAQSYFKGNVTAYPRRVGAFAGYFYKIDQSAINPSLYWLGFQSPTNVLWELVPYSFVVDWFANVGDYLTSLSTFPAFIRNPQGYLSTSQAWIITSEGVTHNTYPYTPLYTDITMPSASWETWSFSRELISPGDYTGLRFDVNLDLAKVIDLFALSRNLLGSNRSDAYSRLKLAGVAT